MRDILISKDSRGKTRIVDISCEWNDAIKGYVIIRKTSQYLGKITDQPIIEIKEGKAKRTLEEQTKLEYNSNVKKYLDKGYKNITDLGISYPFTSDPGKLLGDITVDANNAPKPMLAKSYDGISKSVFDNNFYGSTKLDGVRALLHWNETKIITASRGGTDYDVAASYITQDPYLIKYLSKNPDIWLDGELYIHGKPLSYISGLCRLKTLDDKHKELKYYVYDLAISNVKFEDRLKKLSEFKEFIKNSNKVVVVNHIPVSGWGNIMKLHNKYVSEGYEGLVIRDPSKEYKYGARDIRMIKIKIFSDSEFKILDLVDGLRDEDMCFLMETKEGYQFKAKPVGDRALKQYYRENIESLKGKMGTVKYFRYTTTDKPVPNLPVFKCIREPYE